MKKKITVHKRIRHGGTFYYFTKSKNCFLGVKYKIERDYIAGWYGKNSTSGCKIEFLEYHTNNAIITDDCVEITMSEVPESIKKILIFLR